MSSIAARRRRTGRTFSPEFLYERFLRERQCVLDYRAWAGPHNLANKRYALSFSRTATKLDRLRSGVLAALAAQQWPSSGRIDPAYSNLCIRSGDLTNAAWGKTRLNATTPVVAGATLAPDGTMTGFKVIEDNTAANTHFIASTGISFTAQAYSRFIYIKAGTRTQANFRMTNYAGVASAVSLDLTTGAVIAATGAALTSYKIEEAPNAWWKVTVFFTSSGSGTGAIDIELMSGGSSTYDGDNASYIYLWGPQVETGLIAHPYYPTTTVAAGPDGDRLSANVSLTTDPAGGRTYICFYEQDYPLASYPATTAHWLHSLKSGSPADNVRIASTGTAWRLSIVDESVTTVTVDNSNNIAAGRHVSVAVVQPGNSWFSIDGIQSTVKTNTFSLNGSTALLQIGYGASNLGSSLRIRAMIVLDQAITLNEATTMEMLLRGANP